MWLGLGQPVVRDKESDAQSDEDTQGRPPGKGNNTFFSHREIGVTAGFAGSDHLLEQGSLEIWQLSGRKTSKRVKTTRYGGWGGGEVLRAMGAGRPIEALAWLLRRTPGRPREGCPVPSGPECRPAQCPTPRPPVSGLCRAWPRKRAQAPEGT